MRQGGADASPDSGGTDKNIREVKVRSFDAQRCQETKMPPPKVKAIPGKFSRRTVRRYQIKTFENMAFRHDRAIDDVVIDERRYSS